MSDFPATADLAKVRLKNAEGRYQAVRAGDGWAKVTRFYGQGDTVGYLTREGREGTLLVSEAELENAGFHRSNCLDMLEELADVLNIHALLATRFIRTDPGPAELNSFGNLTGFLLGGLAQAEAALRQIHGLLPEDFNHDQVPVERDDVSATT